jgi:pyruvyltransferase
MLIWRQPIRHKAYWWRKVPNFGDAINPLLLRGLSGLSLEWSDAPGDNNLACVGSIVSHAKPGWVVWGAGCISADCPIPTGLTVIAVRGPLTRQRMLHAGYQVPAVFGDPGLLMPLVKPLEAGQISHEWGIIPHFSDFGHPAMKQFQSSSKLGRLLGKFRSRKAICINPMGSVRTYLKQFSRCRAIASSSLHGLIMAEAYGKPSVWIRLEDGTGKTCGMNGGEFKFFDFYQGISKPDVTPLVLKSQLDIDALNRVAESWRPMNWDPIPLMESFPEKTSRWDMSSRSAAIYFRKLAMGGSVARGALVAAP